MSIQITKANVDDLKNQLFKLYEYDKSVIIGNQQLDESTLINVKNLLSSNELNNFVINFQSPDYYRKFDYAALSDLLELFEIMYQTLSEIKERVDIEQFFREGYTLDIHGLKKKYKELKLYVKFPDINFKRIKELYETPPQTIHPYYDDKLKIIIDKFVYRKYIIGIIQMLFNEMDLLIGVVGPEGSGKSTRMSQDMYLIYWTLKEFNIINYDLDIKEMWFNTLPKFREAEDKYFHIPFRIIGLDEGNELNRQDWKDDEVKTFFQRLRRERYNQRIKFIGLPVLGELITNIVLSRMNFIINMVNKNELKTGTLYKDEYEFYIIPRGDKIYSPFHKKELTRTTIKSKLFVNLKDKEYLKGMPREIMLKKCKCNGVWGFRKEDYIKELKESNKTYSVNKGLNFGLTELFMFFKSHVTAKKIGIKKNDIRYSSLSKLINKINNFFYEDPDLLLKYESMFNKKLEDKQEQDTNKLIPSPEEEKFS